MTTATRPPVPATRPAVRGLVRRVAPAWRRWHVQVLGTYLLSRVVSTTIVLSVMPWAAPDSAAYGRGLLGVLTSWDGAWFAEVAKNGYPSVLTAVDGTVANNAWAFRPLFPVVVDVASFGQSTYWPWAAVGVAVVCGAAATLVLGMIVRRRLGDRAGLVVAALFAFGPTSFILQSAYAESLGLLLAFAFLYLIDSGRYAGAGLAALGFALTREGVFAMSAVAVVHVVTRLVENRRMGLRSGRREVVGRTGLVAATAGLTVLWPGLAWLVTGVPDAYARTILSWRAGYGFDPSTFVPFMPWIRGAERWFGAPVGYIVLGNLLLVAVAVMFVPVARRLGTTTLTWYAAFSVFLLASFFPQSSTLRAFMPLAPMLGVFARLRGPYLATALFFCVSVQTLMVWNAYAAPAGIVSTP